MSYTDDLAAYVAALRYDALPPSVVRAAKRITLDLLGVIFPATKHGPGMAMNGYVRDVGGTPRATVVGTDIRTSTANAALANGTMAGDMELDDVHTEGGTHPSSVYVPALLAVAEDVAASGTEWITALAGAYDVGIRVSMAMDTTRMYSRGFHPTSVCGTFGAAAGAARLLRLDAGAVGNAFGSTGSQASGLLTWEMEPEHYAKSFQSGIAARNAVTAVELAARGYVGAPDTLDGRYNMFDAFTTHRDFPRLTEGLGSRFEIEHTDYKFYTCCRAIHAALDIVLELAARHTFTACDVAGVTVWLTPSIAPLVDNNVLISHNLQFIVAVGLFDGKVTRAQTTRERRADPAVTDLAGKVLLLQDADLERKFQKIVGPTRVELRLTDGRTFEVEREAPRGGPIVPVGDDVIEDKFVGLATHVISEHRARSIVAMVRALERLPSMRDLTALLAVA